MVFARNTEIPHRAPTPHRATTENNRRMPSLRRRSRSRTPQTPHQKHRAREDQRKYAAKYAATPRGKAAQRKYKASPRGKAAQRRYYQKSKAKYEATLHRREVRREYQRKYRATPTGKAARKRNNAAYYKAMKAKKAGARAMSQGDEAKNAENMAECLARNDCAGDPCGHRPGTANHREY